MHAIEKDWQEMATTPHIRKIIHAVNRASFQGGIEQLVYDTVNSLRGRGLFQVLLSDQIDMDTNFTSIFDQIVNTVSDSMDQKSLIVFCHDPMLILKYPRLLKYKIYLFVHDHNLVCIRKHKYYPVSKKICNEPLGFACIKNGCIINRARESTLGIKLNFPHENRRLIQKLQENNVTFIVGSRWMKQSLIKNNIKAESISVINPITDQKTRYPSTKKSRKNLLFVGQLVTGKGVDFLLNAMTKVEKNTTLDIIGDGVQRKDLENLSKDLGLQDRVVFHGKLAHEQVEHYYQNSKFLIVPSRWPEPFGMVGLEAMRHGMPVIAFDVGGISEWLTDQKNGLLVKGGDVHGLAHAISKLLTDSRLYTALSEDAIETSNCKLNHRKYILDLLNVWGVEGAA